LATSGGGKRVWPGGTAIRWKGEFRVPENGRWTVLQRKMNRLPLQGKSGLHDSERGKRGGPPWGLMGDSINIPLEDKKRAMVLLKKRGDKGDRDAAKKTISSLIERRESKSTENTPARKNEERGGIPFSDEARKPPSVLISKKGRRPAKGKMKDHSMGSKKKEGNFGRKSLKFQHVRRERGRGETVREEL